ncbi:MoxR family ATPase [Sulfurivirga sp.]|uniref:AAA family ATPase n=1 Tax=Sulfurivirga sp. TaxID=2614236 RepID=UPI0025EA39BD|nr:MoxR family ATPase [Sulfurivirga sp.]
MNPERFHTLLETLNRHIIGQPALTERMLITLLADGHLLVEGPPGLAKTKAVRTLANLIEGDFHRIQFTPDLLPSDVTGTEVWRHEAGVFEFQPGPIFHNLILADEINRAPAKVQSALLEAMAEGQVTVGNRTLPMPRLFMVMATQNPIEQEGTYPLPEAQLDRFLIKVDIDYPRDAEAEQRILQLVEAEARHEDEALPEPLSQDALFEARRAVLDLHMADSVRTYIVQLILATRQPDAWDKDLARWIQYGASPRATLALARTARVHAWLAGKDFVSPDDVRALAADVLRHRLLLTFDAEAEGITPDQVIERLLTVVPVA